MQTAVHVTHEAIQKIGGIGAVLQGLLTSREYLHDAPRNILIGPFWPSDDSGEHRLGRQGDAGGQHQFPAPQQVRGVGQLQAKEPALAVFGFGAQAMRDIERERLHAVIKQHFELDEKATNELVAEATQAELGRVFRLEPTPPLSLKGLSQPVSAWRVIESLPARTRFDARESRRGAFFGRATELDLLLERWRRAQTGQGQLVLLSGEAGIGKSRLVAALDDTIHAEPHLRLQ